MSFNTLTKHHLARGLFVRSVHSPWMFLTAGKKPQEGNEAHIV